MNFKSLDLTLEITPENDPDNGEPWVWVRIKELPLIDFAPDVATAMTQLTMDLADYVKEMYKLDTICTHCPHPAATHFTTNNGKIQGCVGPLDPNEGDDEYCANDCEGFETPGE